VNIDPATTWLEDPSGERISVFGNSSIGRASSNTFVWNSSKVSRRHALLHVQNIGEYWLIDLGSANGTFLNKRRLHQPVHLHDGDDILFGDIAQKFRQPVEISSEEKTTIAGHTMRQIERVVCWLMVADLENFTPLSRSLSNESLAALVGGWITTCKALVEARNGAIDKYLGDGFLAFWRDDKNANDVSSTIHAFKHLQSRGNPDFRIVIHLGAVAIGGVPSMSEESLMGKEVNFVFRMEKLAGSLGETTVISETARERLQGLIPSRSLGHHLLKGFDAPHEIFRV